MLARLIDRFLVGIFDVKRKARIEFPMFHDLVPESQLIEAFTGALLAEKLPYENKAFAT